MPISGCSEARAAVVAVAETADFPLLEKRVESEARAATVAVAEALRPAPNFGT